MTLVAPYTVRPWQGLPLICDWPHAMRHSLDTTYASLALCDSAEA